MKFSSYFSILAIVILTSFTLKNNTQTVKDYLSISGPVTYNKSSYNLTWSAHPNGNYYKQEYLPANEKSETFNQMLLIEAVVGNVALKDAVKMKVDELELRKKTDPVANYQVIQNPTTGEYLLDFVVSQSSGKVSIVEWNAYRYVTLKDKSAQQGVLLVGCSKRSYGANTTSFLKALKTQRLNDINVLSSFEVPKIIFKSE